MNTKDINSLIEMIATDICIHQNEEEFLLRSAKASSDETARTVLEEIAQEIHSHVNKLNNKQQELKKMLLDMQK